MDRILLSLAVSITALLAPATVSASPSYKDESWGVVPQDHGSACVVVLSSQDRTHAFHFTVDGGAKRVTVGILDSFVPDRLPAATPKITVNFGPLFIRQLQFEHRTDGAVGYLAANLSEDDLKTILAALETGIPDVTLSFANGDVWRIPGPKEAATAAIAQCWNEALTGIRVT